MHDPIHHPYIRNWRSESGKRSEDNRLPALRITICGNPGELGVHGVSPPAKHNGRGEELCNALRDANSGLNSCAFISQLSPPRPQL
jgi:hypothetical protein